MGILHTILHLFFVSEIIPKSKVNLILIYVQLTLKHGFELHKSTYTQIFKINTASPFYLWVSHLRIHPTTYQKQYFHILICCCEGLTIVKFWGSKKLHLDF